MKLKIRKNAALLAASLILLGIATGSGSTAPPPLPNPVLALTGLEIYEAGGKQFTRYNYRVYNLENYPNELFAASPELPPCGANKNSSRTWVDVFDQRGKRLYGFCALGNSEGLSQIWFALESDVVPPSWIYIELNDRKTNTKYKSNLAETTN